MVQHSLLFYPELEGQEIRVGITNRTNILGEADSHKSLIRLKVSSLCYNTVGHELMHLSQRTTHINQDFDIIPYGEKQCDIWTLARNKIFADKPPYYLKIPNSIRSDWHQFSNCIRDLCIESIACRHEGDRRYIVNLESKIKKLDRC
jgi:hypothetical protein